MRETARRRLNPGGDRPGKCLARHNRHGRETALSRADLEVPHGPRTETRAAIPDLGGAALREVVQSDPRPSAAWDGTESRGPGRCPPCGCRARLSRPARRMGAARRLPVGLALNAPRPCKALIGAASRELGQRPVGRAPSAPQPSPAWDSASSRGFGWRPADRVRGSLQPLPTWDGSALRYPGGATAVECRACRGRLWHGTAFFARTLANPSRSGVKRLAAVSGMGQHGVARTMAAIHGQAPSALRLSRRGTVRRRTDPGAQRTRAPVPTGCQACCGSSLRGTVRCLADPCAQWAGCRMRRGRTQSGTSRVARTGTSSGPWAEPMYWQKKYLSYLSPFEIFRVKFA